MNNKIITMTAWRRPDYTKHVIDNLKNCIGFDRYTLLPTIEPGHPEVLRAFDDLQNCEIIVNKQQLGCATNTLKALERGFEKSDFVIHIEDDTVPGIDSLKYFEYINKRYKDDKDIFSATAYNNIKEISPNNYFTIYRCNKFTGWMWATWKDRFEEMKKKWDFNAWDIGIDRKVRRNRYELCPNLPRSQNIGAYKGTYTGPSNWKRCQYNLIWVNSIPNISNILSQKRIPQSASATNEINELSYFETYSNNCLAECYVAEDIAIVGIVGIFGIIYIIYKNNKSYHHKR